VFGINDYEANSSREDASVRFFSFLVGVDILRKSKSVQQIYKGGFKCFEITGLSKEKK